MSVVVKKHKPTSPGRRGYVSVTDTSLKKKKGRKSSSHRKLTVAKSKSSGRNNQGRITAWQRGGGHKRKYRVIDWKRKRDDIPAKVEFLEYDPNRTANIALILYKDGVRSYIIAPKGLQQGDTVQSGIHAPISVGNCLPLANIPLGTVIHCVELKPGKGAQLVRSAGCYAQLLAKEGKYATIRLKSGEMRKILVECRAVIGTVSNSEHNLVKLGKAGRSRWKNRRPNVRGVAMNPVDHPMGGGEGKTSGGRPPCSPWGLPEGKKTRSKKASIKLIVRRRKRKSEK